ncbi:helix-turn-helix domain-containing protein [Fibrella aquatilis]|uniref:Helix-turn-helix domain-containing protein n=1 Tax=Fibrella aquatilis TaxID=2817059 RepID=A0A939G3G2_9BACT|nr:helix-turn-helix domain-containing protein [Fibrella aquatilis]MBO0929730.1 helix-turn-helix domain-containing protein [Fibrella aquatilis]
MKQVIQNYDGLYGEQHAVILPDFVQIERIETRSFQHKWVIKPHIHTQLFQLFCVETGNGTVWSDAGEIPFCGPCLLLFPENTLHGLRYEVETTGFVLTISASFIDELTTKIPAISLETTQNQAISLQQQPAWFAYLTTLLNRLSDETADTLLGRAFVVQALLAALLTDVFRYVKQQIKPDFAQKNRRLTILRLFQKSIRHSRDPQKNIAHYADEQHITAVHLNRVCRDLMQKSAMQVVYDYFLTEARNYLIHSDYTVAEVAYRLNFTDPAYFSRLFKKQTGSTPKAFRQANQVGC